jgi:hypothetical protein
MTKRSSRPARREDLPSSLIVTIEQIPFGLGEADCNALKRNLEHETEDGKTFFFRDCPEVRRALRMKEEP